MPTMKCNEIESLLVDYIDHALDAETVKNLEQHLSDCAACYLKMEQTRVLMIQMATEPELMPDEKLALDFDKMLETEIKAATQVKGMAKVIRLPYIKTSLKIAASILLLLSGFVVGIKYESLKKQFGNTPDVAGIQKEMKEMKQMLMFSLLKQESASERIKAVNFVDEMPNPDEKVINALLNTLNTDKNPNVRLAAAYSLSRFGNMKYIRDSLVQSLARQNEPIVQITLINMLVELREVKAIQPLQEILKNKSSIDEVKAQADKGLKSLTKI
jgi:hypothetical protein